MSNYNTILKSNNTDLQTILNTINALPESGGGSSNIETCTVECVNTSNHYDVTAKYTTVVNGVATMQTTTVEKLTGNMVFSNVVKNSYIYFFYAEPAKSGAYNITFNVSNGITRDVGNDIFGYYLFAVSGSGTINFDNLMSDDPDDWA